MAESVLNMKNGIYRRRHLVNKVMLTISLATLMFGLFWLFWIILTLVFKGAPTAATRFGGPAERVFLEVGPETKPCSHPLIPDKQCLQVREVRFDENGLRVGEPGEWQNFFDEIEGYTHQPGVRNVLRIDRYTRKDVPADASRYAYVLDMVVESEQVQR